MNTVKILNTTISEISLVKVSNVLNSESSLKVAICNTNTVVRSYRDNQLSDVINSFDIKTPDGFPIAKSSSILYKNGQHRVDGYNVFLSTITVSYTHLRAKETKANRLLPRVREKK